MLKKYLVVFAAIAAVFAFASCNPDEDVEKKGHAIDHLELRINPEYPQTAIDNFDLHYSVLQDGKSLSSGTMTGDYTPLEVTSGITGGRIEISLTFTAKESFRSSFQPFTDYYLSEHTFIGLYAIREDGTESELISFEHDLSGSNFSTFTEEKIPEAIAMMENYLAVSDAFTLKKNRNGEYDITF